MNPLNNFFASSEHYVWQAPNAFENTQYPSGSGFIAQHPTSQATIPAFTSNASADESHPAPTAGPSQGNEPKAHQARHRGLRWDQHQVELQKLYLVDNKTLDEIRQWMSRERSFTATPKQYKDRFKVWGWQKNLPVETAQFMVVKANERKRAPVHKDTTFEFGGMSWTKERAEATIKRAKKQLPEKTDIATPNGVIYQTPINVDTTSPENLLTPYNGTGNVDEVMTVSSSSSSDEWESEPEADANPLPLIWDGKTQSDVHTLFLNARNHARNGEADVAEAMLQSAVTGYSYLLGPAHEETDKVVHTLATFYYEHDRLPDAYKVLEQSCRAHVQKVGIEDRRAYQYVLSVVELLNGWNKEDDALAFLARAKELVEQGDSRIRVTGRRQRKRGLNTHRESGNTQDSLLSKAARSIADNPQDPTKLDYGLSVARAHTSTNATATEQLLLTTINQCGQDTNKLAVQRLKAWAELLRLYQKSGGETADISSFENAHTAFTGVMRRFPWHEKTRKKFESFRVIEAALELVAAFVKANYLEDAKRMFQRCEEQATATFGDDDERTIWMLISIGLVYQTHRGWDEASPWFQQALNIAMAKYEEDDGIRISLEEAMEVRHFSYVNDEGRPYKTIFGVGGLKIMPMRLHME
ncbi:hypothetical protein CC86DRAFT_16155 [Ophiobolus disseminans]|uniref:Clr5 domain-containing protein n=1 Tax=Ophiobolus disseminans TaxID=1469910 RepID=A0A6A7AMT9_9PLEO|nr:hypothetical protein CC86DRAFT_16155 [Ophiobolus disseminans]